MLQSSVEIAIVDVVVAGAYDLDAVMTQPLYFLLQQPPATLSLAAILHHSRQALASTLAHPTFSLAMLEWLWRPLAAASTLVVSTAAVLSRRYERVRLYYHLGLYLSTLGAASIWGLVITVMATATGQVSSTLLTLFLDHASRVTRGSSRRCGMILTIAVQYQLLRRKVVLPCGIAPHRYQART